MPGREAQDFYLHPSLLPEKPEGLPLMPLGFSPWVVCHGVPGGFSNTCSLMPPTNNAAHAAREGGWSGEVPPVNWAKVPVVGVLFNPGFSQDTKCYSVGSCSLVGWISRAVCPSREIQPEFQTFPVSREPKTAAAPGVTPLALKQGWDQTELRLICVRVEGGQLGFLGTLPLGEPDLGRACP